MNPTSNPDPASNQNPEQAPVPPVAPISEPTTPLSSPIPGEKKPAALKPWLLVTIGVALLALIGFGIYTWGQAAEQKKNDAVVVPDTDKVVEEAPVVEDTATITSTLPNGKTATYANTESNRNITFASSAMGVEYVDLSHRAVEAFIASVDEATLTKLCGPNGERAQRDDIVIATMSTVVRSVQYPTENSCLDELATLRNTDPAMRAAAAQLVEQVASDIRHFYAAVVVK
jgi:hypothetical protein